MEISETHLCCCIAAYQCRDQTVHRKEIISDFCSRYLFWLAGTKCITLWSVRLPFYWVNHSFLLCNDLPQRFEAFPHFFRTRVSFLLAQFNRLQHKIFVKKPSLKISFQEYRLKIKTSFGFFCLPEVVIFVCDKQF